MKHFLFFVFSFPFFLFSQTKDSLSHQTYSDIGQIDANGFAVVKQNGKFDIYDKRNYQLINTESFDNVYKMDFDYWVVWKNKKSYLLSETGKPILTQGFGRILVLTPSIFAVKSKSSDSTWQIINPQSQAVLPYTVSSAEQISLVEYEESNWGRELKPSKAYSTQFFSVVKNDTLQVLNSRGQQIVAYSLNALCVDMPGIPKNSKVEMYRNFFLLKGESYTKAIYNTQGKEIAKVEKEQNISPFLEDGLLAIKNEKGYALFDTLGNKVFPFDYRNINSPIAGFIKITKELEGQLDSAATQEANKGIKKSENPLENNFCNTRSPEYRPVWKQLKQLIRLRDNKVIWESKKNNSIRWENGLFIAESDSTNLAGLIDTSGIWRVPAIYTRIVPTLSAFFQLEKDDKLFLADKNGNILPLKKNTFIARHPSIHETYQINKVYSFPHYSAEQLKKKGYKAFYLWKITKYSYYKDELKPFRTFYHSSKAKIVETNNIQTKSHLFGKKSTYIIQTINGGKWKIRAENIIEVDDKYLVSKRKEKSIVLDKNGKQVSPKKYDKVLSENGKTTYYLKGKELKTISIAFDTPYGYSKETDFLAKKEIFYGLNDSTTGKNLIPFQYKALAKDYLTPHAFALETQPLYGLIDSNHKEIFPPQYLAILKMRDSIYYLQKSQNEWIVADKNAQVIPNETFSTIKKQSRQHTLFILSKSDTTSTIYDETGKIVLENIEKCIINSGLDYTFLSIQKNGKWGMYDYGNNKWLIETKYTKIELRHPASNDHERRQKRPIIIQADLSDNITDLYNEGGKWLFSDDISFAIPDFWGVFYSKKQKWGLIDWTGKVIVPCKYRRNSIQFSNSFYLAERDIYNSQGKFLGKKANIQSSYKNGLLLHDKGERHYLMNEKGKNVFDFVGKYATYSYYSPIVTITLGGKTALFDTKNLKLLSHYDYDSLREESDILFLYKNNYWGAINSRGDFVLPCEYDKITLIKKESFSLKDDYFQAKKATNTTLYDENGKKIAAGYDFYSYPEEGLCAVSLNGKVGVLDIKAQKLVAACEYEGAEILNPTLISLRQECKYSIINREGKEIHPLMFDYIKEENDFFIVVFNKKQGLIDSTGKWILPCEYEKIEVESGFITYTKDKKMGLSDIQGNVILPLIYENISILTKSKKAYFSVNKNHKSGLLDDKGEVVIPIEYKYVVMPANERFIMIDSQINRRKKTSYIFMNENSSIVWETE